MKSETRQSQKPHHMGFALTGHIWKRIWRPKGLTMWWDSCCHYMESFEILLINLIISMKKIILFLLIAVSLAPSVMYAAWYNPRDWFKKTDTINPVLEQKITELEIKLNAQKDLPIETEITQKVTEEQPVVKEKIVTQVIKVDNPELQSKIDLLIKENESLRTTHSSVTLELNACRADYIKLKQESSEKSNSDRPLEGLSTQCKDAKTAYQKAVQAVADLETWRQKEQAKYRATCGLACVSQDIERDYGIKIQPLNTQVTKTSADMKVYCE